MEGKEGVHIHKMLLIHVHGIVVGNNTSKGISLYPMIHVRYQGLIDPKGEEGM